MQNDLKLWKVVRQLQLTLMNINIGIFTKHPSLVSKDDTILYLKPHQINKETMEFKIIVDELLSSVSIDPFGTRSDEVFWDNSVSF